MRNAANILEVRHVTKRFGVKDGINDVSLTVREGEIYGILGPNSSGKSTLLKTILGHLKPESGSIEINHYDNRREFTDAIDFVGAIFENPHHYSYLTGWQNLLLCANMYPEVTEERMEEVVALVGLGNVIHDKVSSYTFATRQRLAFAMSILNYPQLLILDEPMNGLDPLAMQELGALIRNIADNGVAVVITSHLQGVVSDLCDRVGIMFQGYMIAERNMREFRNSKSQIYSLSVDDLEKTKSILDQQSVEILRIVDHSNDREALPDPMMTEEEEHTAPPEAEEIEADFFEGYQPSTNKRVVLKEILPPDLTPTANGITSENEKDGPVYHEIVLKLVETSASALNRALVEAGIEVAAFDEKKQTLEELYVQLTGGAEVE